TSVRLICGVVGLLAAAWLAASAAALDLPPTPTVTVPGVTVPTVPVPPVPVPTVPTPTPPPAPVPVPTPAPPAVPKPPAVPHPQVPPPTPAPSTPATSQAPAAPASPATSSGSAAPFTPAAAGGTSAQRRTHVAANRPALHLVIAHFRLARRARIRITIQQLAPVCRTLPTYFTHAQKGANVFHFPAHRIVDVGTYHLVAQLHGHRLFSVRARRLAKGRIRRGGKADVCSRVEGAETTLTGSTLLGASGAQTTAAGQLHVKSASARKHVTATAGAPQDSNPVVRAVTLRDAPSSVRPLLLVLLALSIGLLGTAAVPQRALPAGRTAAVLTQRRAYLAAAGIWLLAVVVVVTVFS